MNLQSFKGTPDSLKLRFKGFERKLSLGAPENNTGSFFLDLSSLKRINKKNIGTILIFID